MEGRLQVSDHGATPLLRVRDLRVEYPAMPHPVRAVAGVSLELQKGETLALVGESGCGKSTLARAIVGLETPVAGSVHFAGEPMAPFPAAARRALAKRIQMVFQDPDASLNPRLTIHQAVSEGLELHEPGDRSARSRKVDQLLEQVGLDAALGGRYPHELSGGQKQRVSIARALAVGPDLLVCDEAVSALDVSIQAQILSLLLDLKARLGLSYLFITHDLRVVRQIADRVAVMYLGQLVEVADAEQLFTDPRHPYTRVLLDAVPAADGVRKTERARAVGDIASPARPPSGCRFHPRCPLVMERCRAEAPPLYEIGSRTARCFLVEPKSDE
jgi:oligopeptide/dipeptide ABC transporter ATP-binding protein